MALELLVFLSLVAELPSKHCGNTFTPMMMVAIEAEPLAKLYPSHRAGCSGTQVSRDLGLKTSIRGQNGHALAVRPGVTVIYFCSSVYFV